MTDQPSPSKAKKRYRDHGDDAIHWDKPNKCYVGTVSLGFKDGKRIHRTVRGKTKAEVKDNLDQLHAEITAGIRTPTTYTIEQCVKDWLDSIEREDHTLATVIVPAIRGGATVMDDVFGAEDEESA